MRYSERRHILTCSPNWCLCSATFFSKSEIFVACCCTTLRRCLMQLWFDISSLGISSLAQGEEDEKRKSKKIHTSFYGLKTQFKKRLLHYNRMPASVLISGLIVKLKSHLCVKLIIRVTLLYRDGTAPASLLSLWTLLTRSPPHSWPASWGCARSPWGGIGAGPGAAWRCTQSLRCHSWFAAWTACCAWCGGRVSGGPASPPCGPPGRSAAGRTTAWCRHCRRRAHSAAPVWK